MTRRLTRSALLALVLIVLTVLAADWCRGDAAPAPPPLVEIEPLTIPSPPELAPTLPGTPAQRDERRRNQLLILRQAAYRLRVKDGSYPTTKNRVQTMCRYKDLDAGCRLQEFLDQPLPSDPAGDENGYWYESDGATLKLFASLEGEVTLPCLTDDTELRKHPNLVCVVGP